MCSRSACAMQKEKIHWEMVQSSFETTNLYLCCIASASDLRCTSPASLSCVCFYTQELSLSLDLTDLEWWIAGIQRSLQGRWPLSRHRHNFASQVLRVVITLIQFGHDSMCRKRLHFHRLPSRKKDRWAETIKWSIVSCIALSWSSSSWSSQLPFTKVFRVSSNRPRSCCKLARPDCSWTVFAVILPDSPPWAAWRSWDSTCCKGDINANHEYLSTAPSFVSGCSWTKRSRLASYVYNYFLCMLWWKISRSTCTCFKHEQIPFRSFASADWQGSALRFPFFAAALHICALPSTPACVNAGLSLHLEAWTYKEFPWNLRLFVAERS